MYFAQVSVGASDKFQRSKESNRCGELQYSCSVLDADPVTDRGINLSWNPDPDPDPLAFTLKAIIYIFSFSSF